MLFILSPFLIDVFTRFLYSDIIEKPSFLSKRKGLNVHVRCNCFSSSIKYLSDVLRDFKKFTSNKILKAIEGTDLKVGEIRCHGS
jgi:putative transposase